MNIDELILIKIIRKEANEKVFIPDDDHLVYDQYGGNVDDCYEAGFEAGSQNFAAMLLDLIEGD